MEKAKDKKSTATANAKKVKEEKTKVAGGKCWRGKWLKVLCSTGEIFNQFPMRVVFTNIKAEESGRNMSSNKK